MRQIYRELSSGFRSGKTRSIEFRKNELIKFAYMMRDNKDRIIDALFEDQGKLKHESVVYVHISLQTIKTITFVVLRLHP